MMKKILITDLLIIGLTVFSNTSFAQEDANVFFMGR